MKPDPHFFDDIHTHGHLGPRILTSIDLATEAVPDTPEGSAWFSVGIHPWSTAQPLDADALLQRLDILADDPRVAAIGEAGLDARRGADRQAQDRLFIAQAEIAERHHLPLIIHCVGRYGRLLELHALLHPRQLWIVHGFTGKPELARQLTARGIALSLGPRARTPLPPSLPSSLLFTETD